MRRADQGYPRGSYDHHYLMSQAPNMQKASYQASAIHEVRQQQGPSPSPSYGMPPGQPLMDPYAQNPYGGTQSPQYQNPSTYPSGTSPFAPGQNPYPQQVQQYAYSGQTQPPVSAEMHPTYTYTTNPTAYGYDPGRTTAPRYTGPGYDTEQDFAMVSSGMGYPATSAPDHRTPMDSRYTPESAYSDRNNRPQPARGERRR